MAIEIMVVTAEEKAIIEKARAEYARKKELDECFAVLKETLEKIEILGGSVRLPGIGGKYVSWHHPRATTKNVECRYDNWGY